MLLNFDRGKAFKHFYLPIFLCSKQSSHIKCIEKLSLQIKIAGSLSLESSSGTKQHLREIDRGEEYHRLFNTGHETADDMVHEESMSLHLSSLISTLLLLLLLRVS